MRITIIAMGSRGDIQPYVGLGKGLREAGYDVCMPAPEIFRGLITGAGLEFLPIKGVNPQEFLKQPAVQEASQSGNKLRFMFEMLRGMKPLIRSFLNEVWESCQASDAIISTMIFYGAYDSAEKLGVPCIHTLLNPAYPTSAFPSIIVPFSSKVKIFNKLTHKLLDQMFWQPFRPFLNVFRKQVLNLPPHKFWGPFDKMKKEGLPVLFAYSPFVIPKPKDWGNSNHITGYWFYDENEDFSPPSDLVDFINSGTKPVYIGFGSMTDKNSEKTTEMILEALRISGQRGIISSGWAGLGGKKFPDSVFVVGSIPHSWLFRQVSATVIHGGAGTTAASMRAGVPTIVTPFLGDQPFWGNQVYRLGIGPKPVPFKKLTGPRLAELISQVAGNEGMKLKDGEVGKIVNSENGVDSAVRIIDKYLALHNGPVKIHVLENGITSGDKL